MNPISSPLQRLDKFPILFFAVMFFGAFSIAFVIPLLSTYIIEELQEPAFNLALVIGGFSVVSLATNRIFGGLIDGGNRVKPLLLINICAFTVHALIQLTAPSYLSLVILGIPLIGISAGALSTMYSTGRLIAEQTGRDPGTFNLHMRICLSLGWVFGPPTAFLLYGTYGFQEIHLAAAISAFIWLTLCLLFIPATLKTHIKKHAQESSTANTVPMMLLIACVPVFALSAANSVFFSAGPVYFIKEMGLSVSVPGWAFATKSLFEVIIIYFAIKPTQRIGERNMMLLSGLGAMLFFATITSATSVGQVLMLCIIEGMYYGICASVGITFIQNYARHKPGIATSYFVNAIFVGGLAGNVLTGVVASYTTFQNTILSSVGLAALATLILLVIKPPQHQQLAQTS
ncbi:MFS transporter, SET family, sugar efflux transporter [Pseudovibrio ascidiaceicola]|uniref:MFS transporter, SET family, sugar efflux transporter n=1 Tax=Pseudovibrio ascidiaceicola TaxID=285279 RepID=A0A1I3XME3_9HYPH|nr:MFS transporter [Pseudovibrio ascidiaceicola]SFK20529.1 MFS transporter, SET family, sugar efflux transporter [Pseudovibrio ascidiaceicola]